MVSSITFLTLRGSRLWSGTGKRYAAHIEFGYTTTFPVSADTADIIPFSALGTSWTSVEQGWGIFYNYCIYGHYSLRVSLAIHRKQASLWITKAVAISFAQFYVF